MTIMSVPGATFSRPVMRRAAVWDLERFAQQQMPYRVVWRTVPGFRELAVECPGFEVEERLDNCPAMRLDGPHADRYPLHSRSGKRDHDGTVDAALRSLGPRAGARMRCAIPAVYSRSSWLAGWPISVDI